MRNVLVTGSRGFIGKNLCVALGHQPDINLLRFEGNDKRAELPDLVKRADLIFHLAGANRPVRSEEFSAVNVQLTEEIVRALEKEGRRTPVVFSSSTQADLATPYGKSKRRAEEVLSEWAARRAGTVWIYRLPGVFGKWSRPDYNSVVATFCHNIARGLAVTISDPEAEVVLAYVDDVVRAFVSHLQQSEGHMTIGRGQVEPEFRVRLGALAELIRTFRASHVDHRMPDVADAFVWRMYATYVSFQDPADLSYELEQRADARGTLAELLKSEHGGQFFVSRTAPGVTRGNHYHMSKVEKFCVLEGDATIRLQSVLGGAVTEIHVSGRDFRVVDIPPGMTHSIENVGRTEMVVLFWASEVFNRAQPDTYASEVHRG